MSSTPHTLSDIVNVLSQPERIDAVRGLRRGLERESLRITPEGRLSEQDHPRHLSYNFV